MTARRLQTIGLVIALAMLGFALLVYVAYALNLMQFPFDYDQGEGFELVDSIMLARGEMPYRNTEAYPFYSSNYPPLFHVLAIPFVWLFGNAYWYGRLLGFLATLITAGAIGYAVQRGSGSRWFAVLAGLAYLSANTVYHIGPLFRQHITMVMFETLAVVILSVAVPQKRRGWVAVGFALLIVAGYTKQLAAITAIAVLLWFFIQNPRRAVLWGIGFGLAGGAVFVWLNLVTEGEWWRQAIVANTGAINVIQVFALYNLYFKLYGFLLVPAVLYVIYEVYFARISLYSVWFVVALLLGGSASGTWGGGDSYFATSIAGMCILSGILLGRLASGSMTFPANAYTRLLSPLKPLAAAAAAAGVVAAPLFYVGYARATFKMPTDGVFAPLAAALNVQPNALGRFYDSAGYDVGGYAQIGHFTTPEDLAAGQRIVARILSDPRPTLSEEAGFSLAAGRDVITNPTQLLNLARVGLFSGDELIRMLEEQAFAHIVLRARFYPVPVLIAMDTYYELDEIVSMNGFNYEILVPRAAAVKASRLYTYHTTRETP
jgi:hypothetical protein